MREEREGGRERGVGERGERERERREGEREREGSGERPRGDLESIGGGRVVTYTLLGN